MTPTAVGTTHLGVIGEAARTSRGATTGLTAAISGTPTIVLAGTDAPAGTQPQLGPEATEEARRTTTIHGRMAPTRGAMDTMTTAAIATMDDKGNAELPGQMVEPDPRMGVILAIEDPALGAEA